MLVVLRLELSLSYRPSRSGIKVSYFLAAIVFLLKRYASGAAKKIELNEPEMTPIPKVNANNLSAPVPKIRIAATTKNVVNEVPIDLLIVCRRLISNNSETGSFQVII